MRHYPSNSPEAMARLVALALMADGAIDLSEVESLQRHKITKQLGLDDRQFDKVVHDFCEDMLAFAQPAPSGQLELDHECIDSLLDEIQDPDLQNRLLSAMLNIVNAEGNLMRGEVVLVSRAMKRWGLDLRATESSWEPRRNVRPGAELLREYGG
jgi:uncharacterized tellurite resistance protein B-like protein